LRAGLIGRGALFQRHSLLGIIHFPPVAWFTSQIEVPKCLMDVSLYTEDKITGERKEIKLGAETANAIALNRIALGFPISQIGVVPWPEHPGYARPNVLPSQAAV
jgi:hypothetical protein